MTHAPHRNLPHLLLESREALMRHFRPLLQARGVTEQQWRIVRALLQTEQLEPHQLCTRCLISSPSITGVLMRMEEAGLIQRTRMAHDQRRVSVRLSQSAHSMGLALAREIEDQYALLEKQIGTDRLQAVYDVLDVLLAQLGQVPPPKPGHSSEPVLHP